MELGQLREMCDSYYEFEPGVLEPGGARTYVNVDYNYNSSAELAELALDFYNRENKKKFNLVKVVKLNFGISCECMIFWAQDDGSDERRLFRCVVGVRDKEVLLCEIKYDAENSHLVDHVDDNFQKLGERDEDMPSDTCSKDDLGDCSAPGSDGVILVSPTMFCRMGEKSFSVHKMCDDYMDPCLYEKCQMMASVYVDCFDWVTKYAKLAINFYNKKEQKNFILVKVERLYSIGYSENQYCMTFWARNGRSDEFRLFRAVITLKDDDKITIPAEQDDACVEKLNESDELCPPLRLSSPNISHNDLALDDNWGVDTASNSTLVISCSDNTSKMKRGASAIDGHDDFTMETQSSIRLGDTSRGENSKGGYHKKQLEPSRNYVSWNRDMDIHLAKVLIDQMAQGNKCDGDTWKPQALQAAVTYLNSKLHLNLTKENIKNRLKAWKKYYRVITNVQKQSGFSWDEERKMIMVTSDEYSSWKEYVESHPDAKGLQNKVIENWSDIVLLCGRDRATGLGAETFEEGVNVMGYEEAEVNSAQDWSQPSDSLDSMSNKRKKAKKDALVEVVGMIATSFQEFLASKKKEERPSGIEIHEVVSNITGLASTERFKAVEKLMNDDVEWFRLLKALPEEEKREWVYYLINS